MEVEHLDKVFVGTPYILGPINGPRWHVYSSDHLDRHPKFSVKEQVLEIAMFDLDRDAMKHFYCSTYSDIFESKESKDSVETKKLAGTIATRESGIASILPGFDIDEHLFNPCGYSCNGLKDEFYYTIHVTPEPHCSFVSFETNVPLENNSDLINKVLSIFRPGRFCVLIADDGVSNGRQSLWFDGFASVGATQVALNATSTVSSAQFVKCTSKARCDPDDFPADTADCPSSDTDGDKAEKSDKKKKRKKRCKKKKKKSL